ncbi:MAG: heavy metal-binding domain-containing protein [Candidatus Dormibacteraeota bacterium]|uniref:Heavy metal-binding domain-containing protein n=1 Tax=Candidatus Amunia macphersoniae TaxID=3127014 RepID=A0A934NEW5_9BACT|nr:heavy metal-binding domain-containing protein [Candidatus Dormibacteraeota bacterium]
MPAVPHPRADAALQCLATGGGERHQGRRFSSDLSVDEAVLLKEVGYEPCGLVVGSAVYHIGWQTQSWNKNQEMSGLTQVMYAARRDAVRRMERHAQSVGGQGVVGMKLDVRIHRGGENLAEFVAIGTAVASPTTRAPRLWLSDLSGQDLYLLVRAGYQPVSLAFGACVYHVAHQGISARLGQATQNVELSNYTQALYEARELAMTRMQDEARGMGAHGIVAMRIEQASHIWGSHVIEFLAIGTTVAVGRSGHQRLDPAMVLALNDADVRLTNAPAAVGFQRGDR